MATKKKAAKKAALTKAAPVASRVQPKLFNSHKDKGIDYFAVADDVPIPPRGFSDQKFYNAALAALSKMGKVNSSTPIPTNKIPAFKKLAAISEAYKGYKFRTAIISADKKASRVWRIK